jgi:hypothetical protein
MMDLQFKGKIRETLGDWVKRSDDRNLNNTTVSVFRKDTHGTLETEPSRSSLNQTFTQFKNFNEVSVRRARMSNTLLQKAGRFPKKRAGTTSQR